MLHLIYVNILVILMDITLLCTEYASLYEIQITFKGALYSIKLRLEFAVLNDLLSIFSPRESSQDDVYSYSERGTIPLSIINSRHQPPQGNATYRLQEPIPAPASGQHQLPLDRKMDGGCIVMTTEVVVENEEPNQHSR